MTTHTINRTMQVAFAGALMTLAVRTALAQDDCGTRLSPIEAAALMQQEAAGAYILPPMTERHILNVPLSIHIVRQNGGEGGISVAEVDATIADANNAWRPGGIAFFRSGSVDFINSDDFYVYIDSDDEIDTLTAHNSVDNTINVYFTLILRADDGPDAGDAPDNLCGRGSFSTSGVQGVAMANTCTNDNGNTTTFAHELGHYLDLLHTHETALGLECPDGSNCGSAGDYVCDTAAAPDLTGMLSPACAYTGVGTRCSQLYNPDPTNMMSYGGACRTRFTEGQRLRALATLVNLRPNLLNGGGLNVTWLDFGYGGTVQGTFNQPHRDFWTAIHWVAPNGTMVIKAGVSNQTGTYDIPCTIDTFRGWATIGQQ